MPVSPDLVRLSPKVVLHDHLDGGLRPATVLELSREQGVTAPGATAEEAADWFFETADSGSLPKYLETFDVTVGLMQTPEALRRVAREYVEDMASDHVVYAETRWAPQQHTAGGLSMGEAVDAVQAGLDEGMAEVAELGRPVVIKQLLTAMRQLDPDPDFAELVTHRLRRGVVGVDLAGPEAGFGPERFLDLFDDVADAGGHVTIHAGEGDGLESIRAALTCGAERLGHGVRLVEDITSYGAGVLQLGEVAAEVLQAAIALEVCPSSNVQTGLCNDVRTHPVAVLWQAGLPVTISPDNRLMSRTSATRESTLTADALGWEVEDLHHVAVTAADAASCDEKTREIVRERVDEGFAAL